MIRKTLALALLYFFTITLFAVRIESVMPQVFVDAGIRETPDPALYGLAMVTQHRPLRGTVAYLCAGVWVDEMHILTTAHAIYGKDPAELMVITAQMDAVPVLEIRIHKDYSTDSFDNDLALLKVEATQGMDKPSAPLVAAEDIAKAKAVPAPLRAIGWTMQEGLPVAVDFKVQPMTPATLESIAQYIPAGLDLDAFIAAEPVEPGSSFGAGNSGAPLFTRSAEGHPVLTGITSFMIQDPTRPAGQKLFFRKLPQDFSRFKKIVRTAQLSPSPYAIHPVEAGQSIDDSFKPQNRIKGSLPVYVRHFRISPEMAGDLAVEIKLPDGTHEIQQLDPFISVHRMDTNQLIADGGQSGNLGFEVEAGEHYRISVEVQLKPEPDENGVPFQLRIR